MRWWMTSIALNLTTFHVIIIVVMLDHSYRIQWSSNSVIKLTGVNQQNWFTQNDTCCKSVCARVRVIYVPMNWKHQKWLMQLTSNIISTHTHTTGIHLICAVCVHINKNHTTDNHYPFAISISISFIHSIGQRTCCVQWYFCQNCGKIGVETN